MLRKSDEPDYQMATDAAGTVGYGCVFGSKWFVGEWPNEWKTKSIAFLELYSIYATLHLWVEMFKEKSVRFLTDNISLIPVINKLYSKDANLRRLVKPNK